jgi:hypothetical protein
MHLQDVGLPVVVVRHVPATSCSHADTQLRITDELQQSVGKGASVARWNQQTGLSVYHYFRYTTHSRRDDREADCLGFYSRYAE